jgi:NitT/TauT family transport system substrate-binding protein
MARLTTLSKFLIALVIVGLVYFGITYFLKSDAGKGMAEKAKTETGSGGGGGIFGGGKSDASDAIKVGVVTWGGYIGGQYFNEGFEANTNSRFYKDYGFKVDFKILDDPTASRNAWKNGEVDLLWATIDALPTEMSALAQYDPKVVFQSDWSRGGDAIVARRGISSIGDLRGKKISVAEMSPSHSFLIWMLNAGGMTVNDVQLVKVPSPIEAADAFKANQVDAAVVWSPFDEECIQKVPGSRILESTRNASNIIADVFIAKGAWLDQNREKVQQLYEGWMKGAAEINASASNKTRAAAILAKGLDGFSEADALGSINNVRLATHGDNINFFGLNSGYKGVKAEDLYLRMTTEYKNIGVVTGSIPSWRNISYASAVQATNSLAGAMHAAEGQKDFSPVSAAEGRTATAVATKRVSISFRSGEFQLDENSKYIIDKEFLPIAQAFSNARVRVEGNTDNVGNHDGNVSLSQRRAQAVVDYMIRQHSMPKNRFLVYGNGPDKPVAPNTTDDGKAKNRRTDFELIPE